MGRICSLLRLTVGLAIFVGLAPGFMAGQEPVIPTLRGNITAVQPPDGFDVDGYHVLILPTTQFLVMHGPRKDPSELRSAIAVGVYTQVIGDKDRQTRTVTARQIRLREEGGRVASGFGVIDRIITPGQQPVFRADGFVIRLDPAAEIRFSGTINSIAEIDLGVGVRYLGRLDNSGQLVATRVEFIRPKPRKRKGDPAKFAQVTEIPSGSLIDFDGTFSPTRGKHKLEDAGGQCGWYPVPDVPSVQQNVRIIGMSLVPRYQRDLPDDSPEKIPFRFYVVEEDEIRADISCYDGLVLIPVTVVNRVQNKSQLAAVLADGVAASLERQHARILNFGAKEVTELVAFSAVNAAGGFGAGFIGGEIVRHQIARKMEDERGRVALGLLADAGYDPWQAPEAWRLLAPKEPPKDPSKLKYPDRAGYQLEILNLQYKRTAASDAAAAQPADSPANPN